MDKVSTRRQRFMGSVDENFTRPIGNAMKEVKKVGLSLRSHQSKENALTKHNAKNDVLEKKTLQIVKKPIQVVPERQLPLHVDNDRLPEVASLKTYDFLSNSTSYVPVDCFDDEQKYLLYLERSRALPNSFLEQKMVTGKMRTILLDWTIQVQERFTLSHDTIHLAWIMIDRCLFVNDLKKEKLQLLGATCMFLAAKYEEVYVPHINDFVYIAASTFSRRDITAMERTVVRAVNFNLGFAYPVHFLRRYRYVLQNTGDDSHAYSKLFCDLFMSVYEVCQKLPSLIAQVSLYLAYYIIGKELPSNVYPLMGITEKELRKECKEFVVHVINFCSTSKELTLHKKYKKCHINPRLSEEQLELLQHFV